MRTSLRIGIVSSSIAVAGSAALAAAAPAGAAPSSYKSTATGQSGQVTVNSSQLPGITVTATPGNSPKSQSVSSTQVVQALQGVPALGPSLAAAFHSTNPSGVDLVTATANADGSSAACAEVFGGDCTASGQGQPVVIHLALTSLPNTQLTSSLQGITGAALVLTINGPTASCSTGPGGSNPQASDSAADISASVENGTGGTVFGPVKVHGGDLFSQLGALQLPSALASQLPLSVSVAPGHHSVGGGAASATAAEIGLNSTGSNLFDIKGASASCGPTSGNGGGGGGNGGGGGTGTGGTGPGNGESHLNRIGTDLGRSTAPAEPWLALNGMP